ncbi:AAA family ATPase [Actinoplanes sp. NPDC051851]|uniref:helix-turn-helix transcriptional regulator n=1 Tax=Actinoplanes sp. NPDC051851 TaxID=3154753 RepID=UPI003417F206
MSFFIGRGHELDLLGQRLADAGRGHARTVLIGGEAGVGKSRLLAEFAARARATGAHLLTGAAEEHFGDPMPYGPLLDALEGFGHEHGQARAEELGGEAYTRLSAFFDFGGDPMGAPQQVFLAVRRMLDRIGADAPVVLILEDLHWADESTLDLVRHLGQARQDDRRLLLVCSYRSNELGRGDPLWQLLASSAFLRRTERIALRGFDLDELRSFLDSDDQDLVRRCLEWSDGIPFYAEQLMAAGALDDPEDVRLPPDMSSVVLARLGDLGRDAIKVLRVAAVAGRAMSRRLLRTVSDLRGEALHEALQECFDRQMLTGAEREPDVYRFRHALLREAVYQSTVRDTRVDLHLAMARAIEADPRLCLDERSVAAEQASHWYHAGVWPQALAAAVQAGDAATRTLAFPSAAVQYGRALALWSRVDDAERATVEPGGPGERRGGAAERAGLDRVELLVRAANAARWSGHVDRAVAYAEQARTLADTPELDERLANHLWEAGRRAESVAVYERAWAALEPRAASAAKARVLAGLALARLQAGQYTAGGDLAAGALRLAREVGARTEEGRALNISGLALGMRGDPEGERRLRQALDVARAEQHIEDLLRAYGNLGLILEHAGRLREAAAVTMEGLREARRLDLANTRQGAVLANNASAVLVLLGEWDEVEKIITEVSLARPPRESLYPRLTLAEVTVGRGRFPQARELLASIEHVEHGSDPRFLGPLHAVRAELAIGEGDPARAAREVALGVAAVRDGENTLELLRLCAVGYRCAPERADAFALEAGAALRGEEQPAEVRQLIALGAAERRRIAGRDEPATWKRVADGWVTLERPFPAAYARWREAAAAQAADDPVWAQRVAREAYREAEALGARPLLEQVAALGVDLDEPADPVRPHGLTRAELEVYAMLYQGFDTARITRARGVSRRTVETQLSKIYKKLAVRSNLEAVTLARRAGWFG